MNLRESIRQELLREYNDLQIDDIQVTNNDGETLDGIIHLSDGSETDFFVHLNGDNKGIWFQSGNDKYKMGISVDFMERLSNAVALDDFDGDVWSYM